MVTVAISGYFNPIHKGHIEYIHLAKKLGDTLVVILNNDKQVKLKGSKPFMDIKERRIILEALRDVDVVIDSIDEDKSVCKTLKIVNPDIWASGGDRNQGNNPETPICKELGIKMVDNVGKKIQSSSELKEKFK